MTDPLDYASLSETAKALVRRLRHGPVACGVTMLAESLGVSNRQALRAIADLRDAGMLTVTTCGRGSEYAATCDMEAKIKATCHMLKPREPEPYTELADVEAARRDRALYCHATGRGPPSLLKLGAELAAAGHAPPAVDVEALKQDRARYFYALGRGPRWALELGAKLAAGEA